MKVYISVDIEGCAGITHWDEAGKNHADWQEFREQMTREAVAAIEGAQIAGATKILVKDAHSSGRNIIASMLPADVRLIRAWAGHPLCMVRHHTQVVCDEQHGHAGVLLKATHQIQNLITKSRAFTGERF